MTALTVRRYLAPPIDRREVLRYAGMRVPSAEIDALLDEVLRETEELFSFRVAHRAFPISVCGDTLSLGFAEVTSCDLSRALAGCDGVLVFAATVGGEVDRAIKKYALLSPAKALLLEALGSERVEALCDAFCADVKADYAEHGAAVRPRFSPGYGDLPLALQKDIFRVLDCERRLGISLGESLLMTPKKSVTALVGVKGELL
ncbi:MAG: Vitamin B12 dependent methionine synthase activation subunit [Clostridia bacterium]|nr:Vitamin B12 dependent methionine synthase activation subunit [Clostridia bacterium]